MPIPNTRSAKRGREFDEIFGADEILPRLTCLTHLLGFLARYPDGGRDSEKETVSSRDVPAPAQREHPSCVVQCKGLECTSACIDVTVKPFMKQFINDA